MIDVTQYHHELARQLMRPLVTYIRISLRQACKNKIVRALADAGVTDPDDTQHGIDEAVAAENKACARIAIKAEARCKELSMAVGVDGRYDFAYTVAADIVNNIRARTNPQADDQPSIAAEPETIKMYDHRRGDMTRHKWNKTDDQGGGS